MPTRWPLAPLLPSVPAAPVGALLVAAQVTALVAVVSESLNSCRTTYRRWPAAGVPGVSVQPLAVAGAVNVPAAQV